MLICASKCHYQITINQQISICNNTLPTIAGKQNEIAQYVIVRQARGIVGQKGEGHSTDTCTIDVHQVGAASLYVVQAVVNKAGIKNGGLWTTPTATGGITINMTTSDDAVLI
jgi:hypothetical protein